MIEEFPDYLDNHGGYVQDREAFCRSLNDLCLECFKSSNQEKEIHKNRELVEYGHWRPPKWGL